MDIDNKYNLDWSGVEKALEEGTPSGYKIAVLETDKILVHVLKEKNYSGKNTEENLRIARDIFTAPEKLEYARTMRRKIIEEAGFEISAEDTKEIIASYYQAIVDLMETETKKISFGQKVVSKIKKCISVPSNIIKKAVIGTFLFFLTVLILADTQQGHTLTNFLVDAAHFIFYKLLVVVAIAAGIIIIIIGTISYFEGRREKEKERIKIEE